MIHTWFISTVPVQWSSQRQAVQSCLQITQVFWYVWVHVWYRRPIPKNWIIGLKSNVSGQGSVFKDCYTNERYYSQNYSTKLLNIGLKISQHKEKACLDIDLFICIHPYLITHHLVNRPCKKIIVLNRFNRTTIICTFVTCLNHFNRTIISTVLK